MASIKLHKCLKQTTRNHTGYQKTHFELLQEIHHFLLSVC